MTRPVREADLLQRVARLEEEVRLLRLKSAGGGWESYDLTDYLNPEWTVATWAGSTVPEWPRGGFFGVRMMAGRGFFEGFITPTVAVPTDNFILNDGVTPAEVWPANYTKWPIMSDLGQSGGEPPLYFSTLQYGNQGSLAVPGWKTSIPDDAVDLYDQWDIQVFCVDGLSFVSREYEALSPEDR